MKKVIQTDKTPSDNKLVELREIGSQHQFKTVLVVLPFAREIRRPAQFEVLPEISLLTGEHIEHHASMELGLLELKTGKLLWQARGTSYATLDRLNALLASSYSRVRGSTMVHLRFPDEGQAMETLRIVAILNATIQRKM